MNLSKDKLERYTKAIYYVLGTSKAVDQAVELEKKDYLRYGRVALQNPSSPSPYKESVYKLGDALYTFTYLTIHYSLEILSDFNHQYASLESIRTSLDKIKIELITMKQWYTGALENLKQNIEWLYSQRDIIFKTASLTKKFAGEFCEALKNEFSRTYSTSEFNIVLDNACKMYLESENMSTAESQKDSNINKLRDYLYMGVRTGRFVQVSFDDDVSLYKVSPKSKTLNDYAALSADQIKSMIDTETKTVTNYRKMLIYEDYRFDLIMKYSTQRSKLSQCIMDEFHSTGISYTFTINIINANAATIEPPKNKSYINPAYSPKLKEMLDQFKSIRDKYNNATYNYLSYIYLLIKNDAKSIRQFYIKNESLSPKMDMITTYLINVLDYVYNTLKNEDLEYHSYSKEIKHTDLTINNDEYQKPIGKKISYIFEFCKILVKSFYQSRYLQFKNKGWTDTFNQIIDNAIKEYRDDFKEEELTIFWQLLDLPKRTHTFKKFEYSKAKATPAQSPKPKKPKAPKKEQSEVPKVTEEPKEKVKETKVVKKIDQNEAYNVLEVSEKTPLGKGYRIVKVSDIYRKLFIDDDVYEIAPNAFMNCHKLEEITLGKNLKVIPKELFNMLTNLQTVNFVEGLEVIEKNAFYQAGLAGDVTLPKSLKEIQSHAFDVKLPSLLNITMSPKTRYYGDSFHKLVLINGKPFKDVLEEKPSDSPNKIPNNYHCTDIARKALFIGSSRTVNGKLRLTMVRNIYKNIIIDDKVDEIEYDAFKNNLTVEEIKLGKNLLVIENGTFANLTELKTVNFVEGLEVIEDKAFFMAGLYGEIVLPRSLKKIGSKAFLVKDPSILKICIYKDTAYEPDSFSEKTVIEKYK